MKKKLLFMIFAVITIGLSACGKESMNAEYSSESESVATMENSAEESIIVEESITFEESATIESTKTEEKKEEDKDISEAGNSSKRDDLTKENQTTQRTVLDLGEARLNEEYKCGIISTDEYVRYKLYDFYGDAKLADCYRSKLNMPIDINALLEEHIDELSKETLQYFWDKACLRGIVSFGEEEVYQEATSKRNGFQNPFVLEVQAEEAEEVVGMESLGELLDKVVVSSKGNFVVWYASDVERPVTEEEAVKIAEELEYIISEVNNVIDVPYTFTAGQYNSTEERVYNNQKKVLEKHGYDESYLKNAMQVYIASLGNDSDTEAFYYGGPEGTFLTVASSILEADGNGCFIFPYIFINRDYMGRFDSVIQVVAHEVFHHMQKLIIKQNNGKCGNIIAEATANWFSAKLYGDMGRKHFLNEHASVMVEYSDRIFNYILNEHDDKTVGYTIFPYFQLYEKYVMDGKKKILESINIEDGLSFLEAQSTPEERNTIMKNLAFNNLAQELQSGATLASEERYSFVPILAEITEENGAVIIEKYDKELMKMHIDYYRVTFNPKWLEAENFQVRYCFSEKHDDTGNVGLYIIGAKNHGGEIVYSLVSHHMMHFEEQTVTLSADICKEFDALYFAVSNASLTSSSCYSLRINMDNAYVEESVVEDPNEEDAYYYQMALSIRNQVDEFFRAISTGDMATVKKYCYNLEGYTADDWDEDSFYHIMEYKCAPMVLKMLLGDMKYYFSDNMVWELAEELKRHYSNAYEWMPLEVPHTEPCGWLSSAYYINSFPEGTLLEDSAWWEGLSESEAIEIIKKCTADMPMEYDFDATIGSIQLGSDATISIDLDGLLFSYDMPDEDFISSLPEEEEYLCELAAELAGVTDLLVGTTGQYAENKEQYDLLDAYLYGLNFKDLQNHLYEVLDADYIERLDTYQDEYGRYEELNYNQKKYVDYYIAEYYKFSLIDYTPVRVGFSDSEEYEIGSEKGGYYILEYPIAFNKYGLGHFEKDREDIIQWSFENDIRYVEYEWFTDTKKELKDTYESLAEFMPAYYYIIDYARTYIK